MSSIHTCRRCLRLLEVIAENVGRATAFGPEARHLHVKLTDLRTFLDEFLIGRYQDAVLAAALEDMATSLQSFCAASQRCCSQGPLETLFTADELLHQLVDSCLRVRQVLARIRQCDQLSTVMRAQANLLSSQLSTATVSYETLHRLQGVRLQLQEESERIRLGANNGVGTASFTAHIHRLAAACSPRQLAADAAFLAQRCAEAEAAHQLVVAHFLQLALSAIQSLTVGHDYESPDGVSMNSGRTGRGNRQNESPQGKSSPCVAAVAESVGEPSHFLAGAIVGALVKLSVGAGNASPSTDRAAQLEALRRALEGPERAQAVADLSAGGGVSSVLRLLATSGPGQRSGPLRLLAALLSAEPLCSGDLVAARGVQVLLHVLSSCLEGSMLRATAARRQVDGAVAVAVVSTAAKSPPARKAKAGLETASPIGPRTQQQRTPIDGARGRAAGQEENQSEQQEDGEVCLLVVGLIRQLSVSHTAELVSAGAVKLLCRAAGAPGGGRLASAAVTALIDLAGDGSAAVQMLQERLLVPLSSLRLSDRPSEAAAATSCIAALLQHPARLLPTPPHQQQSQQQPDLLLCSEMGRACDAASLSALLDLAVDTAAAPEGASWSPGVKPGLSQLLPFCVHSSETRTAVLHHSAAMRLLLGRVAAGEPTAAITLRRVANDDGSKTVVARHLAQMLAASCTLPGGGTHSGNGSSTGRQAAVALCLADVLRPTSRDRSAARWAADAATECEQCGVIQPLLAVSASADAACRLAGLACLHALAVYGTQAVRTALGACGAVMCLVDAVKLEGVTLPAERVLTALPAGEPLSLGQAAAEALAALSTVSEALRQDVVLQLAAFLGSCSPQLAASACQALLVLMEACPAAGSLLVAQGVITTLVGHVSKPSSVVIGNTAVHAAVASRGRAEGGVDRDAAELLRQRAVRLIWAFCRGGGAAVEAAVAAGAAPALLHRAAAAPELLLAIRVEAAAALAPLLKKSAVAREAVAAAGGLQALLELACSSRPGAANEPPGAQWEEALGGAAALAALHVPCRLEAAQSLRQMMVRGTVREAAAAAVVVQRMCSAAAGREAVLAEDLADPLVRLLSSGDERARAAAANAMCLLIVPPTVQVPPCAALPSGGFVRPRLVLIRAGAATALLTLLRDGGEAPPTSSAASIASTSSPSSHGSAAASGGTPQLSSAELALVAAAETLESLVAGEEGVQAVRNAGGVEVLKALVARGKRRLVPQAAAKAASAALLQCV